MKKCPRCQETKNVEEFSKHAGRKDGLQPICKKCQKAGDKERWRERGSSHYEAKKARRKMQTLKVRGYLLGHPCVDCGERDPIVLDFDHVRGVKIDSICDMIRRGFSWSKIEEEIAKCEVRCSNCHRRRTAKQQGWLIYGM